MVAGVERAADLDDARRVDPAGLAGRRVQAIDPLLARGVPVPAVGVEDVARVQIPRHSAGGVSTRVHVLRTRVGEVRRAGVVRVREVLAGVRGDDGAAGGLGAHRAHAGDQRGGTEGGGGGHCKSHGIAHFVLQGDRPHHRFPFSGTLGRRRTSVAPDVVSEFPAEALFLPPRGASDCLRTGPKGCSGRLSRPIVATRLLWINGSPAIMPVSGKRSGVFRFRKTRSLSFVSIARRSPRAPPPRRPPYPGRAARRTPAAPLRGPRLTRCHNSLTRRLLYPRLMARMIRQSLPVAGVRVGS
ncbi:hypothetical protein SBRY_30161 [Actinacidiphila bryophytorum]|uniref:Uncharacterized protein n=1 Tax=Actinacidiphila bryophytorum TaxID=1436133 RepID=A0A9W4H0I7_9ACTN|nr:hypothetical protein SBRY_30161 [Actinacidiphila bryophytorum]